MVGIVASAMKKAPVDPYNPTGGDTYTDANGIKRLGKDPNASTPMPTGDPAPTAPTAPTGPQSGKVTGGPDVAVGDPANKVGKLQPTVAPQSGGVARDPANSDPANVLRPPAPTNGTNQQVTPTGTSPTSTSLPSSSTPDQPVTREVGAGETVQGQLNQLLANGSPLLEAARSRAQQYAAGRGLVNSAMAGQAGEEAVINTATPIATADAGTMSRQALANQDVQNQFLSQGRTIGAQAEAAEKERKWQTGESALQRTSTENLSAADIAARERMLGTQLGSQEKLSANELEARERMNAAGIAGQEQIASGNQAATLAAAERSASTQLQIGNMQLEQSRNQLSAQERMANSELQNRLAVAGLNHDTSIQLATADADLRRSLQAGQISASMVQGYGTQLSQIMADPNMSTEDKNAAATNLLALYQGTGNIPITVHWGNPTNPPTPPGG